MAKPTIAYLSSSDDMTSFTYGDTRIRFKTSRHLQRYLSVDEWDKGYIVCTAAYDNADEPEEDYIDLVPILENLYFDSDAFLQNIQEVQVSYA